MNMKLMVEPNVHSLMVTWKTRLALFLLVFQLIVMDGGKNGPTVLLPASPKLKTSILRLNLLLEERNVLYQKPKNVLLELENNKPHLHLVFLGGLSL